jgi:hypothetical protein
MSAVLGNLSERWGIGAHDERILIFNGLYARIFPLHHERSGLAKATAPLVSP